MITHINALDELTIIHVAICVHDVSQHVFSICLNLATLDAFCSLSVFKSPWMDSSAAHAAGDSTLLQIRSLPSRTL